MNRRLSLDTSVVDAFVQRPNSQPVDYAEQALLHACTTALAARPPLMRAAEVVRLRVELAAVHARRAPILQIGECAKRFGEAPPSCVAGAPSLRRAIFTSSWTVRIERPVFANVSSAKAATVASFARLPPPLCPGAPACFTSGWSPS